MNYISGIIWSFLLFTVSASVNPCEKRFRDLLIGVQQDAEISFRCPTQCTTWKAGNIDLVLGTTDYHVNSRICLAAVHAGVIEAGNNAVIQFRKNLYSGPFIGTISNRIISKSSPLSAYGSVSFTSDRFIHDPAPNNEIVMVHNNHHVKDDVNAFIGCLPNNLQHNLKLSTRPIFTKMDYFDIESNEEYNSDDQPAIRAIMINENKNPKVLRCVATKSFLDVTGILGRESDSFYPVKSTVTASVNDSSVLRYTFESYSYRSSYFNVRRNPHVPDLKTYYDNNVNLSSVQLTDRGLYKSNPTSGFLSYIRLIVRDCSRDRYGKECSGWCRDCLNSGECDSSTGECVCSPGTHGKNCHKFCSKHRFGSDCHLSCSKEYLLWITNSLPGSCKGLTFCVRDPRGCSCLPGYVPPKCDDVCTSTNYGPDCEITCDYCNQNRCDNFGTCDSGCKQPALCSDDHFPLNLPRFREPPTLTDCSYRGCSLSFNEWDERIDDGEMPFLNKTIWYEIDVLGKQRTEAMIPVTPGSRKDFHFNFIRRRSYEVKLHVMTSRGKAETEYKMRVHETTVSLECLENYSGVDFNFTTIEQTRIILKWVDRNDDRICTGQNVNFVLITKSGGSKHNTYTIVDGIITISDLQPRTSYDVTLNGIKKVVSTESYPPSRPENVEVKMLSNGPHITWNEVNTADNYTIIIQLIKYAGCNEQETSVGNTTNYQTTQLGINLLYSEGIMHSVLYALCIGAVNSGGPSVSGNCVPVVTPPAAAPLVEWDQFDCSDRSRSGSGSLECTVNIVSDCRTLHGPNLTAIWTIRKISNCEISTEYSNTYQNSYPNKVPLVLDHMFNSLEVYTEYDVSVLLRNSFGNSDVVRSVFTTYAAERPAKVSSLKIIVSMNDSLTIGWTPPCPTEAPIKFYNLRYKITNEHEQNFRLLKDITIYFNCTSDKTQACYLLPNLQFNVQYNIEVRSCTEGNTWGYCSNYVKTIGKTEQTTPGKPSLNVEKSLTNIQVSLRTPKFLGERPHCWISLKLKDEFLINEAIINSVVVDHLYDVKFEELKASTKYLIEGACCNSIKCGLVAERSSSTKLADPVIVEAFRIGTITNTSAVVEIPVISVGDADSQAVIIITSDVNRINDMNFTMIYQNFIAKQKKRSAEEEKITYVAGVVDLGEEFIVGSGETENNPPLTLGKIYTIIPLVEIILNDQRIVKELTPITFTAGGAVHSGLQIWIIILILIVIAVVVILCIITVFKLKPLEKFRELTMIKNNNGTSLPNEKGKHVNNNCSVENFSFKTDVQMTELRNKPDPINSSSSNQQNVLGTSHQEDTASDINANTDYLLFDISKPSTNDMAVRLSNDAQHKKNEDGYVNLDQMEAFLNSSVNSYEMIEKFKNIPNINSKSTSEGERDANRKKNRYRNNITYNDTRVQLNILNGDKFSDYINANHISGVTENRRYIASQGPKDNDLYTIGDFWRMIIEQEINVVIMVANFKENGVLKVGQYFNHEYPVQIHSPEGIVTVKESHNTSACIVSTIKVRVLIDGSNMTRYITHYHFTNWSDHEVDLPNEHRTLGYMIESIATNPDHENMHTLVHCSTGIVRTGTVLFCLLCYDHLLHHQKVDIFKVIYQLRSDRGRLLENQLQFKLCLNLIDEMLFGTQNSFGETNLMKLENILDECSNLYQRLNYLPNTLYYSTANHPNNLQLNRNLKYLPPNGQLVDVQDDTGEILYINAVIFNGFENGIEYIATQHPMKDTLDRFWNMVHSKKYSNIAFLNNEYDEEYPQFYPVDVGEYLEVNSYLLECTEKTELSAGVTIKKITCKKDRQNILKIHLLELHDWKRGSIAPVDLCEVVKIAVIILSNSNTKDSPPLFVCGDGVTACGMTIGITNMIDRLKTFQDIDVYRTAVMLRRCHPSAIVHKIQLEKIFEAAAIFNNRFSN